MATGSMQSCRRGFGLSVVAALLFALLSVLPGPAHARWLKAESARFIVYSNGQERSLRAYAAKLEGFEAILRAYHAMPTEGAAPRKFEVYLIANNLQLRRVAPTISESTYGLYVASRDGIFAIGLRDSTYGDHVLFHEYTHHFMMQHFPYGYPAWVREGYAEYFSTVTIEDTTIEVGRPSPMRAGWLLTAKGQMPMARLLTATPMKIKSPDDRGAFYAQSWHLTHYMFSDPERKKQMDAYLRAVASGAPSVEAMEKATGMSVDALGRKVRAYQNIGYTRITREAPAEAEIQVTTLPASADDLLLDNLRPHSLIPEAERPGFVARMRGAAARRPDDRLAQLALARAEVAFGDRPSGEAILKRYLAADPKDVLALRLMGLSKLAAGEAEPARREEHYRAARPFLVRAGKADPDDFQVLFAYARSRMVDTDHPTENTLNALLTARALAPQVGDITVATAHALIQRNRKDEAAAILAPVANDPHGGETAAVARGLLATIAPKAEAAADAD